MSLTFSGLPTLQPGNKGNLRSSGRQSDCVRHYGSTRDWQWKQRQPRWAVVRRQVAANEDVEYLENETVVDPEIYTDEAYDYADQEESDEMYEEAEYFEALEAEPFVQPMPRRDVQQTLARSFFLSNFTHHSDEEASIRVMPALAGEGRYFVKVAVGAIQEGEELLTRQEEAAAAAEPESSSDQDEATDRAQRATAASTIKEEQEEKIVPRSSEDEVVTAILENAIVSPENGLFTTLQQGESRIYAAEGLLSALEACGIDNARIEIEGNGELPVYDGSASGFAYLIKQAGVRVAPGMDGSASQQKQAYAPQKTITVREGDSFVSLMPSTSTRISYGIDHTAEAPVIGKQWVSWSPSDQEQLHFRWAVAPARPYFTSQKERLDRLAQGYYKASYEELVLVAEGKTFAQLEEIRFTDEPVRRRLLEFLGDLSLLSERGRGGIPEGHIIAFQASKELHLRFLRAIKKVCGEETR